MKPIKNCDNGIKEILGTEFCHVISHMKKNPNKFPFNVMIENEEGYETIEILEYDKYINDGPE